MSSRNTQLRCGSSASASRMRRSTIQPATAKNGSHWTREMRPDSRDSVIPSSSERAKLKPSGTMLSSTAAKTSTVNVQ